MNAQSVPLTNDHRQFICGRNDCEASEVVPAQLDEETALALMVQNPLLIRRPLLQVGARREVGFNLDLVEEWIGLRAIDASGVDGDQRSGNPDLEICPRSAAQLQPCGYS